MQNRYTSFLLLYFILAVGLALFNVRQNTFFIGKWFYKVPSNVKEYSLYVTDLNLDKKFSPNFINFLLNDQIPAWGPDVYAIVQQYGQSVQNHDVLSEAVAKNNLQKMIFKKNTVKFDLYLIEYDPYIFATEQKLKYYSSIKEGIVIEPSN